MKETELKEEDIAYFKKMYEMSDSREEAQKTLAKQFGVVERTIRKWAKTIGLGTVNQLDDSKIMVYDIETSQTQGKFWWTGEQRSNYTAITKMPNIISIAYKWLGDDEIYLLHWDMTTHDDKEMMSEFLKAYNQADMVIGQNNNSFDNKWINTRAAFHNLVVDVNIKSFDIMRQARTKLRLPSFSMAFLAKFFGVTHKQGHEGILMWNMVEDGTPEQQAEYMGKMLEYNRGDIITTEEIYVRLRKYLGHKVHFGVKEGGEKWSCPNCGSEHVSHFKTSYTARGSVQRFMICNDCEVQYGVSNKSYLEYDEKD